MLVVDTSVLLAAADNADPDHQACAETIQNAGPLVTTALVIAETAYLIGRQLGAAAEARFFRAVADGELQIETLTPAETRRIAELIETYADLGLGGTDASLIVIAERMKVGTLATLDRRHYDRARAVTRGNARHAEHPGFAGRSSPRVIGRAHPYRAGTFMVRGGRRFDSVRGLQKKAAKRDVLSSQRAMDGARRTHSDTFS